MVVSPFWLVVLTLISGFVLEMVKVQMRRQHDRSGGLPRGARPRHLEDVLLDRAQEDAMRLLEAEEASLAAEIDALEKPPPPQPSDTPLYSGYQEEPVGWLPGPSEPEGVALEDAVRTLGKFSDEEVLRALWESRYGRALWQSIFDDGYKKGVESATRRHEAKERKRSLVDYSPSRGEP